MAASCPHRASTPRRALRRQNLRQEPSAVVPLAGICAGGWPQPDLSGQGQSLPRLVTTGGTEAVKANETSFFQTFCISASWGSLIHATVGSFGGVGCPANRDGLAA